MHILTRPHSSHDHNRMSDRYETRSNWSWPEATDDARQEASEANRTPGAFGEDEPESDAEGFDSEHSSPSIPPPQKHYATRICRICLEEVPPSFELRADEMPSMLHPAPKVSYNSVDASLGRLIRPCQCRGSQKYVHEGCLEAWRYSGPSYTARNFWECPTCKYQYRLERMRWSRVITSAWTQILITLIIMAATVFVFGFFADPIINLYLDPYDTITSLPSGGTAMLLEDKNASWIEHFLKGLASLGLLGFIKTFFAMSPWHWVNLRQAGALGGGAGRRGGTGLDRLSGTAWVVAIIGVITFFIVSYTLNLVHMMAD